MACLIKLPTGRSKGVVSFTTPEEKYLRGSASVLEKLHSIKDKYVLCLHHNWHNDNFRPDNLFDIHFAGRGDLIVTNGARYSQIEMDACNFVRPEFSKSNSEKHWDVLFVGNAVFFKDPIQFLKSIREIYDSGHLLRVLYLCPLPPYKSSEKKNIVYDIRKIFEEMFSPLERQFFNLLILKDDYPRFFDRQTLAHFYKSSKIFVHTAPDERRCRVAAYAWAAQMPVVGRACVGSILPDDLRAKPAFYLVDDENSYASQIVAAIADYEKTDSSILLSCSRVFSSSSTVKDLEEKLRDYFVEHSMTFDGQILDANLDFRMGWQHGFGLNTNSVNQSLSDFLDALGKLDLNEGNLRSMDYPEYALLPRSLDKEVAFNKLDANFRFKLGLRNIIVSILHRTGLFTFAKAIYRRFLL